MIVLTSNGLFTNVYQFRIHLPDGEYRPAYVCHVRDNIKYTYKKMWHIANLVRGLSVDEALKQLDFINKKGAFIAAEVISSLQFEMLASDWLKVCQTRL